MFGDVGAVVHAHPPYTTAVAGLETGDTVTFERFEIIKGLGVPDPTKIDIPLFANWPHVPDIADDITRRFDNADAIPPPVLLIAHHGATAWGANLEQARNRLECIEALCQLHLIVMRGVDR
jgi:methylthioribose-1-phosphate isomerase/methylthioribulose-1-phosphate dehydratase